VRVETACEKRTLDSVAFDMLILKKMMVACAAVTRHVDAKSSFPEGVGSHPVLESETLEGRCGSGVRRSRAGR